MTDPREVLEAAIRDAFMAGLEIGLDVPEWQSISSEDLYEDWIAQKNLEAEK